MKQIPAAVDVIKTRWFCILPIYLLVIKTSSTPCYLCQSLSRGNTFIFYLELYSTNFSTILIVYSTLLFSSISFILPTLIPMFFWGETLINSWHVTLFRYAFSLNVAFTVNSLAHRWGYRPYNGRILPSQSILLSIVTLGEAFHNYHHAFPWDYRTAELGNNLINFSTKFIDFFAFFGWAYDLKAASEQTIKSKMQRIGDGSNLWGQYSYNTDT